MLGFGVGRRARWLGLVALGLACWSTSVLAPADTASAPASSDQQVILEQLTELRKEIKALRAEVAQLRQAVTEIHRAAVLPPPRPTPTPATVDVALGDGPMIGRSDAAVGIVEFTDFQCPFCKRFHDQTFDQLKEAYIDTGKIQYRLRDFPLSFHRQAKGAALAARCAGNQGGYWPMHHELFTHQRRLGPELYQELAKKLELDGEEFSTCLKDPAQAKAVDADFAYGQSLGVRGTPSFFIGRIENGRLVEARRLSGAQPLQAFTRTLDPLLQ